MHGKRQKVSGRRWRKPPVLPFVSKRSSPSTTYQSELIHSKILLHAWWNATRLTDCLVVMMLGGLKRSSMLAASVEGTIGSICADMGPRNPSGKHSCRLQSDRGKGKNCQVEKNIDFKATGWIRCLSFGEINCYRNGSILIPMAHDLISLTIRRLSLSSFNLWNGAFIVICLKA